MIVKFYFGLVNDALELACNELKNDREGIMEAAKGYADALDFASKSLRGNK